MVNFQLGNEIKKKWCLSCQECEQGKKNRVSNMNRTLDLPIHRSDASASRGHRCVLQETIKVEIRRTKEQPIINTRRRLKATGNNLQ